MAWKLTSQKQGIVALSAVPSARHWLWNPPPWPEKYFNVDIVRRTLGHSLSTVPSAGHCLWTPVPTKNVQHGHFPGRTSPLRWNADVRGAWLVLHLKV